MIIAKAVSPRGMKGNAFVRTLANYLRAHGLTVDVESYTGSISPYERDAAKGRKDVDVHITTQTGSGRIFGKPLGYTFKQTTISGFNMKKHKKIVDVLSKADVYYMHGRDPMEAFLFVGVWDNEKWGG